MRDPCHRNIGEIRQRIAKRRQFPVEHGDNMRILGIENHVVDAVVTMNHAGAGLLGQRFGQPFDQPLHFGHDLGFRQAILLCPAVYLTSEIIAGFAKIGQSGCIDINIVQRGQRVDHRFIGCGAFGRVRPRHRAVPDRAAFDHVHDVEPAADDAVVGAQAIGLGDGKACRMKPGDDFIFAVHGMRAGQQYTQWLAAQHIRPAFGVEPVGRV